MFRASLPKFTEAIIKLKMSKCELFKKEIEHLGECISPIKQKIKAITDLASTIIITEARHITGLVGFYRKLFPIFNNNMRPLNELIKKNIPFKWTDQCQKY